MRFLVKKAPDNFIKSVNDEINSILSRHFDNYYPDYGFEQEADKMSMPVEITEKEKDYEVRAEVPGVKKEDLDIDIEKNSITINAKKKKNQKKIQKVIKNQSSDTVNFQERYISLRKLILTGQKQNLNTAF